MSSSYGAALPSHGRRRRIRRRSGRLKKFGKLALLACGVLLAVAMGINISPHPPKPQLGGPTEDSPNVPRETQQRKIYPYSVIPGGVMNSEELTSALNSDKTAARHYSDFRADRVVLTYARFDHQSAYASYRSGNRVFWTKNRIHIDSTEFVLTDGKNFARTRCGNRLSNKPQKPTAQDEPTEEALLYTPPLPDKLIRVPGDLDDPPFLGSPKVYELSFPLPVATLGKVATDPFKVISVPTGGASRALLSTGAAPEPASILFIISGGFVIGFAVSRKRKRS